MTEGETRGAIFTRSVGKQTAISDKHRCRKDHRYVVSSCPLSLTQAKRERGAPRGDRQDLLLAQQVVGGKRRRAM